MASKDKEVKTRYTVDVDEVELNSLIKELLDGCRDDLSEAEANMQVYLCNDGPVTFLLKF